MKTPKNTPMRKTIAVYIQAAMNADTLAKQSRLQGKAGELLLAGLDARHVSPVQYARLIDNVFSLPL